MYIHIHERTHNVCIRCHYVEPCSISCKFVLNTATSSGLAYFEEKISTTSNLNSREWNRGVTFLLRLPPHFLLYHHHCWLPQPQYYGQEIGNSHWADCIQTALNYSRLHTGFQYIICSVCLAYKFGRNFHWIRTLYVNAFYDFRIYNRFLITIRL